MKRAFYDFSVSPYSFDFAQFLLCAKANDCDEIVIVPGERLYQKCTPGEQEYRLRNLILGLCPTATVCQSREEAQSLWHEGCFPDGYTVDRPIASHMLGHVMKQQRIHPFTPSEEAKAAVAADWPLEQMAVITIRDSRIKPGRNSNSAEWAKAADWMKAQGFSPVFIPDTDKPDAVFGQHPVARKAALDVQYRIALYEAAYLNLGVNNGPMALNLFSRRPTLYFRPLTPEYPESTIEFWRKQGVPYNSQPPWFSPLQRIIWDGLDDFDTITNAVQKWMAAKEGKDEWPLAVAPQYPIKGVTQSDKRGEQMGEALKAAKVNGWKQMVRKPMGDGVISIVCYGPSLKRTWRQIKHPMITVSGAHDFLIARGVVPDYHMDCDPREHKVKMLTPHKGVKYRMATVCHPSLWERLQGHDVELWHLHNDQSTGEWVAKNDPGANMLGGGSTAGMRALEIASMLGYKRIEVHGMDCSFESDEIRHASAHLGKKQNVVEVCCDGVWYKSSPQMIESAKEMVAFIQNYDCELTFHGDGLQQAMVEHFLKRFRVIKPEAHKEAA